MKKTVLLILVTALFLLMATVTAWAAGKTGLARITRLEGMVTVNGRQADIGRQLKDGDHVSTGKKSLCEIVFAEKNILRLTDETSMKISVNGRKKNLELIKGTFFALARKLSLYGNRRQMALTVNTPTAICGVRGTAFCMRVENPEDSYVCLCNGKMHVAAKGGRNALDAEAVHHKAFRLTASAGAVGLTPAEMIYHTDADVESLAGEISEKMDWTRVE